MVDNSTTPSVPQSVSFPISRRSCERPPGMTSEMTGSHRPGRAGGSGWSRQVSGGVRRVRRDARLCPACLHVGAAGLVRDCDPLADEPLGRSRSHRVVPHVTPPVHFLFTKTNRSPSERQEYGQIGLDAPPRRVSQGRDRGSRTTSRRTADRGAGGSGVWTRASPLLHGVSKGLAAELSHPQGRGVSILPRSCDWSRRMPARGVAVQTGRRPRRCLAR